jgi:hypothetical protein
MTEDGRALRIASDAMLRDLELLARLEEEKRQLEPEDEATIRLADEIEALAARLLQSSVEQRALTLEIHADPELAAIEGPIDATRRSISAILEAWRGAERDLAAATPGSPEAAVAQKQSDEFREEYRRAHQARSGRPSKADDGSTN